MEKFGAKKIRQISLKRTTVTCSICLLLNLGVEAEDFFSLYRLGLPLQASLLLGSVMNMASPVLLGSLVGITQVGLVNWSFTIVSLPTLPFQRMPVFLFSVFAERRFLLGFLNFR